MAVNSKLQSVYIIILIYKEMRLIDILTGTSKIVHDQYTLNL